MTAAAAQAEIYGAFAEVAAELGTTFAVHRPAGAQAPLSSPLRTLLASFSNEDASYARPAGYGDATWFGWFDGRNTRPGDYLVGERTFFIAAQQPMLPILAVLCNATVRLARHNAFGAPGDGTGSAVGVAPYSGVEESGDEPLLSGWPASVLLGGRSTGRGEADLPASVMQTGFIVLLPASVPIEVLHGDTLTDDLGRRYSVIAAESSALGWRLQATELHA